MARSTGRACHRIYRKEGIAMAWRPTTLLIEGMLDNTTPGKVTGWMKFAGMKEKVTFDLEGNFHGALDALDLKSAELKSGGNSSCSKCP